MVQRAAFRVKKLALHRHYRWYFEDDDGYAYEIVRKAANFLGEINHKEKIYYPEDRGWCKMVAADIDFDVAEVIYRFIISQRVEGVPSSDWRYIPESTPEVTNALCSEIQRKNTAEFFIARTAANLPWSCYFDLKEMTIPVLPPGYKKKESHEPAR